MGSTSATFADFGTSALVVFGTPVLVIFENPALVIFEIALLVAVIAGAILLAGLVISLIVFIYRSRSGDETLSVRTDDFDPSSTRSRVKSPVEDEE